MPRMEDPTLLRGQGRYTDDQNVAGQAYAVMVRSKIAHGILKGIESKAASAMPGVTFGSPTSMATWLKRSWLSGCGLHPIGTCSN